MSEEERKWDEMSKAMLLALHEVMITSEFRNQYYSLYQKHLSQFRQLDGDNILKTFLKDGLLIDGSDEIPDEPD